MYSSTFGKGWVGMSACPLVVLACESLHVCTVCIWRCEHARFCVEVFYALYINFHSFIHSHDRQGTCAITAVHDRQGTCAITAVHNRQGTCKITAVHHRH